MTLHQLATPAIASCNYPPELGSAAHCITHCSDHQNTRQGYLPFNCSHTGCIHDRHNTNSPLQGRTCAGANCGLNPRIWDAAYDADTGNMYCFNCMDTPENAPRFRPNRRQR
jgi:hypothetical protein